MATSEAMNAKLLSDLRVQRGTVQGQQTKLKNYIERSGESASESDLETRLGLLEGYLKNFSMVQTQLECLDAEETKGDKRETFEETFCTVKSKILTLLSRKRIRGSLTAPGIQVPNSFHKSANLPKLALTKFSGKYNEWQDFYSMFKTLVHDDDVLTNIEKFQHLRSCLTDGALRTIQSLEMTSENFEIALDLLKKRFDNKRLIFQAHIDELFNLPSMEKGSVTELRHLSDTAGVHIRALLSLVDKEQIADGLLIHLLTHKFDPHTQLKWEDDAQLDVIPTWKEISTFMERRCQTMENVAQIRRFNSQGNKSASTNHLVSKVAKQNAYRTSLITTNNRNLCVLCKDTKHNIYNCPKFFALTPLERYQEAKRFSLCINCLRAGHTVKSCKSSKCRYCHSRHHSLLHISSAEQNSKQGMLDIFTTTNSTSAAPQASTSQQFAAQASLNACHSIENSDNTGHIFVATAIVYVKHASGSLLPCRALLDSASQANFITERLRQQLELKRIKVDIPISGIGTSNTSVRYKSNITIKSRINELSTSIEALVLPSITVNHPDRFVDISNWRLPPNLNLADPLFNRPQRIDILIGTGLFFDLLSVGQIKLGENLPTLQKTLLGWVISGASQSKSVKPTCHIAVVDSSPSEGSIDSMLHKFWELEKCDSAENQMSPEEIACEQHFVENYSRSECGRYSVRLPLRETPTLLGSSLETAKRRFFRLESKLNRFPELKNQYVAFMDEYINLKHMTPIEFKDLSAAGSHYFLPHHCVLKPESSSTKLRVVFDGSCKTATGRSLNDILMVGPVVQDDLFTILLRFRMYPFAITADVSKMYRQIQVKDPDNHLQCILWRDSSDKPLKIYRLLTVTYGTSAASFLATRCLSQLSKDEASDFPIGSTVARRDFYVDDMLTGADTLHEALRLRFEIAGLLQRGGFLLRKWCSNSAKILETLPENDKEKLIDLSGISVVKTLGLAWSPQQDEFRFTFSNGQQSPTITKRSVLSQIASLFDPLGLLNPIIVRAKIFMQELWKLQLNWDESLPMELHTKWSEFFNQLHLIKDLKVPRLVNSNQQRLELHGFADASSVAYGACIYLRSFEGSIMSCSRLLCAKSRVAPIKTVSIPRLELCAALILAELIHRVHSSIHLPITNVFCWSDSTIVIAWISSSSCNWNVFVANRVTKIQELTTSYNWRHVPTQHNPADFISRGLSAEELLKTTVWFNGPHFLMEPESNWPKLTKLNHHDAPEKRTLKSTLLATKVFDFVTLSKFHNSYLRLLRVFAFMYRFYRNSLNKIRRAGKLTEDELNAALTWIVRIVQQTDFHEEYARLSMGKCLNTDSSLRSLNPYMDSNGLLRVGGRLQNADIHTDSKHPILLPRHHVFTKALMTHYHNKHLHANSQTLLSIIRTKFWPIGGKNIAKEILHKCIRCFRARPRNIEQLMGILPPERVQPSRPFSHSGVDFFGPLFVTSLIRGRPPTKTYGCIFICFATKAVHIELVSNLSTEAFIGALRRFIARRGKVATIFSDNATNFIGACKSLEELRSLFNSEHHLDILHKACQEDGISWKFIPARSPHFGGLWEASVKAAKYYIRRVAGHSLLTHEELSTLLCQVEAAINSRPITPISNDPNDLNVLTPGHFLIGAPLISIPEPDMSDININILTRWQRVRAMYQVFWKQWSQEYLQSLQLRTKWSKSSPNLTTGTLVLIKEDNTPPLKWHLGRIASVHPGSDGLTRVVGVKTSNGILKRGINKVCPLPLDRITDDQGLAAESPKAGGMFENKSFLST